MRTIRIFLEAIKFEHTIFALPFALLSLLYAAEGVPPARVVGWILVAMVSARTAAMAFNRIVDRDIDALNPRTRNRALPAGLLTVQQMRIAMGVSAVLFLYAAWQLNWVCFVLAPVALAVILGYSYSKRFTPLSHYWLGLSLGIAPSAVWIAVRGTLEPAPVWLTLGVALWVAGFDILYSLQDEAFDRAHGLRSLPQTLGGARAMGIARISHALCIGAFLMGGVALGAGVWYYLGVAFAALMLAYEQSLVKPHDLSRLNVAFFTLNGYVSIGLFVFALLDRVF
ncbi:MAG: 4-hydroxybenzoate octaprenyltransferase [Armatimonadetes bacterium JP3_11]|jgi:4-hydroxybenzoate polyprenyltransferase|nr:MAG: 4-hydroxybenzoate octaprenyltransferase [Armatimonadetes bacterium CP1_7O]OYT75649.1 MAG: 4-hydroxybenzoate octaprenyltransferase [Armatimonadetes bacterium JP3_11]RMH08579.1 MAG: 4-hydroxybenzoate octaprenyltransferase [Armatimonadota bacterium]